MIVEAFQRADGMWSFRRLAMLGVVQDPRAYPSSQAAVEAARAEYPNETVSIVTPEPPEQDMNATPPSPHSPPTGSETIEPSSEDQVDIANRVQEGLKDANSREAKSPRSEGTKPLDGNPAPERDTEGDVFKPADDTPSVLPKRAGPSPK